MIESVFEFLFKYRPVVFERGRLAFDAPLSTLALVGIGVLILAVVLIGYTRARTKRRRDAILLATLRIAALGLLAFALLRPMLLSGTSWES
jgi:hypothetical protein